MALSTPTKIEGTATEIIHYLQGNANGGKYALVLVESTPSEKNKKAIEILRAWAEEDETDDQEILKVREQSTQNLHKQLNKNREIEGAEKLFP
jgi:hypothetical protein